MTDELFILRMLQGGFIMKRPCRRKGYNHAIYIGNMMPVANVPDSIMKKYNPLFKYRKSRITFNLNLVRQEHGNALVKILYKQNRKSNQNDNA